MRPQLTRPKGWLSPIVRSTDPTRLSFALLFIHILACPAMQLVENELKSNQNNSTQTLWRILQGLIKKESFENVAPPTITNAKALNEILLVLRQFDSAIVVCYADQVDENTAKEFGIDPNYFVTNSHFNALTFRSMDHSRIAIILSQVYRVVGAVGDFFAKEVILHELNHAVTTRYCLHKHEDKHETCTPPKLAEYYACVPGECGYLFEQATRGAKVEMIGAGLYLTRPCSAQKNLRSCPDCSGIGLASNK